MAKIKFSALISDVRNSLNGSTFARNRGGAYFRNKTTPTNPQTGFQTQVRSFFGAIASAWRGLTENQRSSWIEGAQNFPYVDTFGDVRHYSGNVLYQKLNQQLQIASQPTLSVCPTPQTVSSIEAITATGDVTNGTLVLAITPSTVPAGHTLVVQATRGLSPGRSFAKNDFRNIQIEAASSPITALDVRSKYQSRFGAMTAGKKIFFRCWFVNNASGQKSPEVLASCIVIP